MPYSEYDYDFDDLLTCYHNLGLKSGSLVYVGSDLINLMRYKEKSKDLLLNAHLNAIIQLIGSEGTLFVPTASLYLCNTNIPFNILNTPSKDMGLFSEYIRQLPGAIRSFHPFWSICGYGPKAHEILSNVSRHAYGANSVWQRFVENDVVSLNVGKHPCFSISIIHHIETLVGVPYRYTKEFIHPVFRDNVIYYEPFYLSVLYNDCDIQRDNNKKIFNNFSMKSEMKTEKIGKRGHAWSFSLKNFFEITTELLVADPYAWLESPPNIRPYQK